MHRSIVVAGASVLSILALAATSPSAPAADAEYKVVEVKDGGKIHGFVRLKAKVERGSVSVFKDNEKGCGAKDHKTERLQFHEETLGVGNALVCIKSIEQGKDWPEAMRSDDRAVTIDQKGCQYLPHVQWGRVGSQTVVLNNDRADHNIHGFTSTIEKTSLADTKFNFSSEPDTKKDSIGEAFLEQSAKYIVKCDIHPWMNAYVFIASNPYQALTSATDGEGCKAGEFTLTDVPAGEYTLILWKEGISEKPQVAADGTISAYNYGPDVYRELKVVVKAGGTTEVPETETQIDGAAKD